MKTFIKAVFPALLLTGVAGGAIVAAPAAAQKQEKQKPLKLSPAFIKAAQPAQAAITAKDYATAEPALAAAEAAATSSEDKYMAASLRLQLESGKVQAARAANPNAPLDQSRLAAPLDALIASPFTGQEEKARFAFARGTIAYDGKQYAQALQYLQQARQLGYNQGDIGMVIMQAREKSGDAAGALADLNAEIERQVAAGQKPSEDLYRYGLARSFKTPQGMDWARKYLTAYPTPKNWRDIIISYGFSNDSPAKLDTPQKLDLFRLMRASKSLADQYDYGEYAQKLRDRGLPAEALTVLQEGIAAGKIPATNTEYKAMLSEVRKLASNEGSLTGLETKSKAAGDGKLAAQTGDAYLSQNQNAKAAELYRVALQKGGVNADEVNTRLGIALANSGDKAGAKAAFAAVKGQPRVGIATLWNTWLDTQA